MVNTHRRPHFYFNVFSSHIPSSWVKICWLTENQLPLDEKKCKGKKYVLTMASYACERHYDKTMGKEEGTPDCPKPK